MGVVLIGVLERADPSSSFIISSFSSVFLLSSLSIIVFFFLADLDVSLAFNKLFAFSLVSSSFSSVSLAFFFFLPDLDTDLGVSESFKILLVISLSSKTVSSVSGFFFFLFDLEICFGVPRGSIKSLVSSMVCDFDDFLGFLTTDLLIFSTTKAPTDDEADFFSTTKQGSELTEPFGSVDLSSLFWF